MKISFLSRLLSLFSPRQCAVCGLRLGQGHDVLCSSCNIMLPRTDHALSPYDNDMAKCFWGLIPIEKAVAFMHYVPGSKVSSIVYDMKYNDHPDFCHAMGRQMALELLPHGFFCDIDVIVPVVLAASRMKQRGYNQSREIALGISEATGLPVADKVVRRTAFTKSQTTLMRWERMENMDGIWELVDGSMVKGKHVLIVDDIITTGATTIACAEQLLKAGDVKVSILGFGFTKK